MFSLKISSYNVKTLQYILCNNNLLNDLYNKALTYLNIKLILEYSNNIPFFFLHTVPFDIHKSVRVA